MGPLERGLKEALQPLEHFLPEPVTLNVAGSTLNRFDGVSEKSTLN